MLNLLSIIVVLFAALAIIVSLLEKYGTEPSPEKLQRLSRWIAPLMALALVLQGFKYFMS